jgi:hypothetical protein
MAELLAPGDYDQLHYFVAAGVWDAAPLETELLIQADRLVGGGDAVLVIDDTALRFITLAFAPPRTGAQGRKLKILRKA